MQAIYTCSTNVGTRVTIQMSDKCSIEDIKIKAAETHDVVVVDVVHEQLLGNIEDDPEDEEDE
jgi:hypothetical protein